MPASCRGWVVNIAQGRKIGCICPVDDIKFISSDPRTRSRAKSHVGSRDNEMVSRNVLKIVRCGQARSLVAARLPIDVNFAFSPLPV
jgi:hypothetical protein